MQKVLVALQYEEASCYSMFINCNFTVWIPLALDAQGRRPLCTPLGNTLAVVEALRCFIPRFGDERAVRGGQNDGRTFLFEHQTITWRGAVVHGGSTMFL